MAGKQKAWETCQWQQNLAGEWATTTANGDLGLIALVSTAAVEASENEEFTVLRIVGSLYFRISTAAGGAGAARCPVKARVTRALFADGTFLASAPWSLVDAADEFLWEEVYSAAPGASTAQGRAAALDTQLRVDADWARHHVDIRVARTVRPPEAIALCFAAPDDFQNPTDLIIAGGWLRTYRAV